MYACMYVVHDDKNDDDDDDALVRSGRKRLTNRKENRVCDKSKRSIVIPHVLEVR